MGKAKPDIAAIRRSLSYALAAAVKAIWPDVSLGTGSVTDVGFSYDFLLPEGFSLSPDMLERIGESMKAFIEQSHSFESGDLTLPEAKEVFAEEPLKLGLIEEAEREGEVIVRGFRAGPFSDLSDAAHVAGTQDLRAIAWKLDRTSGAYWRGNENNPMLQRVDGLAFETRKELRAYLAEREEAMKRDHRTLNTQLELFTFSSLIGKGLPLFLPHGGTLRRTLERFVVDEELRRGYHHVWTPPLGRRELYEVSGHLKHYEDSMYPPMKVGGDELVLRPMTCPHHFMLYSARPRSYRELPLRFAELASQFRKEKSGELAGLVRVMMFTLADAHIFCTPEQLDQEFRGVIDLIQYCMKCLGIDPAITYRVSLRDDSKGKYVDNPAMWEYGESILRKIVREAGLEHVESRGDAAFYGPKLDVQMRNVSGKEETVFTVQIDFYLPEKFDLTYIDETGEKVRPVVIHRASIGCIERTMAFLIEYYNGAFPLWLAPVQARLLTIAEAHVTFAKEVEALLLDGGIRVESDMRSETIGKKIREGRLQRIPYLLVIGAKEVDTRSVTVRNRDTGNQANVPVDTFLERALLEAKTYALTLNADIG